MSMTLSRKRTHWGMTLASRCQSRRPRPSGRLRAGLGQQEVEDVARAAVADHVAAAGVYQLVFAVFLDGAHELLGDGDGDVEVGEGAHVALEGNEPLDAGVGDGEDAHVSAAAGAAPLYRLGGGVEHLQEGDGAGGDAHSGLDAVSLRA